MIVALQMSFPKCVVHGVEVDNDEAGFVFKHNRLSKLKNKRVIIHSEYKRIIPHSGEEASRCTEPR